MSSAVWKYYKVDDNNVAIANCEICKLGISRGGKEKATFNTTNLIRHLKNKHPTQYSEYTQATQPKTSQLTLQESLKRREKMPHDSAKAQDITAKIAQMIAMSDLPFAFVENPGFLMLMEHVEPRFEMPSRHYFTEKALPALYKKITDKLLVMLSDAPHVSFTTDIWSSSVAPMSLLSLTAQWIDSSFVLRRATLHAQEFRGSHTAERIQQSMETMLNNWRIDKQRVHVILRDNAANMKKAMRDMGVPSLGCVAHSCQLCVHEGLLSQRSVTETLANARKIVGHFKHSPLAYSRLEDIQMDLNMDIKRLQHDGTAASICCRAYCNKKRALSVFAAERTLPATLTAHQWELMKKTADVLSPFEELTRDVSRETATAADVIPAITVLRRVLSREDDDDQGIKTMKRTLLEAVEKRCADIETEPLFYIATLLDPRYKDGFFTKSANLLHAKEHLIQEVAKTEGRRAVSAVPEENKAAAAEPVSKSPRHEACSSLDIAFEEILQERQSQGRSVSTTSAETQVQTYLSEKNTPKKSDPLQYWKEHAYQFPSMAAVAAQYLSAPCSSVDSERLFSAVANILDENRNRLKSDKTLPWEQQNCSGGRRNGGGTRGETEGQVLVVTKGQKARAGPAEQEAKAVQAEQKAKAVQAEQVEPESKAELETRVLLQTKSASWSEPQPMVVLEVLWACKQGQERERLAKPEKQNSRTIANMGSMELTGHTSNARGTTGPYPTGLAQTSSDYPQGKTSFFDTSSYGEQTQGMKVFLQGTEERVFSS
ncbi:zinc finger BED domain-containing protein 4-like [Misgurnus anguillicaudatus]|uniref:zinc finger BED domain-containing protein 4-like n=1 Tax=Misgurnus anguillicaudatus TaxID=75329 RepID=UPI003CCFB565